MANIEIIQSKIYTVRGVNVMLDKDLAELYQTETRYLNKMVKRNAERFTDGYMFQLNQEEFKNLKFQIGTSSWGGTRKPPFVFVEHGTLMLATVLNSEVAIRVSKVIIEAFVAMKSSVFGRPEYRVLEEKIKTIEAKLEVIEMNNIVDGAQMGTKIMQLGRENLEIKQYIEDVQKNVKDLLNSVETFRNENIIMRRPEDGLDVNANN